MRAEALEVECRTERPPAAAIGRALEGHRRHLPLEMRSLEALPNVLLDGADHIALIKVGPELRPQPILAQFAGAAGGAGPASAVRHHTVLRPEDVKAVPREEEDG